MSELVETALRRLLRSNQREMLVLNAPATFPAMYEVR